MRDGSIINDYFDSVVYLTTDARPERDARMQSELKKWNITADRVAATPSPHAHTSFNISMMGILRAFIDSGRHRLMVFEDDTVFDEQIHKLWRTLTQLDYIVNWDMFYLGANTWTFPLTIQAENLVKISGAWCTHAHAYTHAAAQRITQMFDPLTETVYDDWLAHSFHPFNNCFLAWPMCATQMPNYSDLLKSDVDYAACWKNTNKRISMAMRAYKMKQLQTGIKIHR